MGQALNPAPEAEGGAPAERGLAVPPRAPLEPLEGWTPSIALHSSPLEESLLDGNKRKKRRAIQLNLINGLKGSVRSFLVQKAPIWLGPTGSLNNYPRR